MNCERRFYKATMTTVDFTFESRPRMALGLQILLVFLVSPAHAGTIRGTVLTCHPRDRDPCANFPELCSAGNGLCVVKKPCEYECVCPPDGRVGRDCSNGMSQASDGAGPNPADSPGTASRDKQVDSLLVFPPDLFWDLNHVAQQEDLIKTIPFPDGTTPYITTPPSLAETTEVRTNAANFPAKITTAEVFTTSPNSAFNPHTTSRTTDVVTISPPSADKPSTYMGSGPDSATHATQKLEGFSSEFSKPAPGGYTQPPTTSSYITNDITARTLSLATYDVPSVAPTSPSPTTAAGGPQGFLPLSESYTGKLNRPSNPQHVARTPSAEERATLLSNAVLPGNLEAQTSKPNLEHPLSTLPDTHPSTSGTELHRTTASPVSHTPDSTVANETASQKNNIPGHSSFPTFFEGSPSGSAQEPSTDKALNRMVHRVFHPMEAFQMHPRP